MVGLTPVGRNSVGDGVYTGLEGEQMIFVIDDNHDTFSWRESISAKDPNELVCTCPAVDDEGLLALEKRNETISANMDMSWMIFSLNQLEHLKTSVRVFDVLRRTSNS